MASDPDFAEDLPRLAAESFALSQRWCRTCGQVHALWPYIRMARASTGVESATSQLQSVLAALVAEGRRRVLIAGAADTGLLALVARAGAGRDLEIVVLDLCAAPLLLCREQAERWSLPIRTMLADLRRLDLPADHPDFPRCDIVVVHGTLHFIGAAHRADVLARLRRALAPAGRLVLLFNTSRPIDSTLSAESRDGYADWVLDELERLAVPLPEPREAFRDRLRRHAEQREEREGAFAAPEDVDALLADAKFVVCERAETGVTVTAPVQDFLAKIDKRRFLVIAEPNAGA